MRITKAEIEKYLTLKGEIDSLRRRADAKAKEAADLRKDFTDYVKAEGGKGLSCTRSGYVLAIVHDGNSAVPWRREFEKIAGINAAEALVEAAPPKYALTVHKVGDKPTD